MQEPREDIQKLGQAWVALADCQVDQGGGCLQADEIWEAASGGLPAGQTRRIVDHLALCPACAEAWQLARRLSLDAHASPAPYRLRSALARWPGWAAAAAAAILLAGLGMERWASQVPTEAPLRQAGQGVIHSLLSEQEPLPRDGFVLAWTPLPTQQEVRYRLTVTSESLDIIAQVGDLEAPRCRIAAQRLSSLPSGTVLQWQVKATLEDGSQFNSPTFLTRLQ